MSATIAQIDYRMRYTSVVMNVTDTQSLTPRPLPGPPTTPKGLRDAGWEPTSSGPKARGCLP